MFWVFGHEAVRILFPQTGMEPVLPALEGEFVTAGPPILNRRLGKHFADFEII